VRATVRGKEGEFCKSLIIKVRTISYFFVMTLWKGRCVIRRRSAASEFRPVEQLRSIKTGLLSFQGVRYEKEERKNS